MPSRRFTLDYPLLLLLLSASVEVMCGSNEGGTTIGHLHFSPEKLSKLPLGVERIVNDNFDIDEIVGGAGKVVDIPSLNGEVIDDNTQDDKVDDDNQQQHKDEVVVENALDGGMVFSNIRGGELVNINPQTGGVVDYKTQKDEVVDDPTQDGEVPDENIQKGGVVIDIAEHGEEDVHGSGQFIGSVMQGLDRESNGTIRDATSGDRTVIGTEELAYNNLEEEESVQSAPERPKVETDEDVQNKPTLETEMETAEAFINFTMECMSDMDLMFEYIRMKLQNELVHTQLKALGSLNRKLMEPVYELEGGLQRKMMSLKTEDENQTSEREKKPKPSMTEIIEKTSEILRQVQSIQQIIAICSTHSALVGVIAIIMIVRYNKRIRDFICCRDQD